MYKPLFIRNDSIPKINRWRKVQDRKQLVKLNKQFRTSTMPSTNEQTHVRLFYA